MDILDPHQKTPDYVNLIKNLNQSKFLPPDILAMAVIVATGGPRPIWSYSIT